MTRATRMTIVAALNMHLREHGSWGGETHIQKAVYFLQELLGVPTEFEFVLYKHGPFSFDLRETIGQMRIERVFELEQQPYPYGPSLVVPPQQQELLQRRFPQTLKKYADSLNFIGRELGPRRVSDLERLATGLFVTRQDPHQSVEARARQITSLKPHISFEEAVAGIRAVEAMAERGAPLRSANLEK